MAVRFPLSGSRRRICPYEGSALAAYFLKSPVAQGRAPTVVLFDGLDNCKEMSVQFFGAELAFPRFNTHFQVPWVMGVPDMDAAMVKLKNYTLAGVAERIECPTLILHGANDRLSTMEVARQLYQAVGARDKTPKVFSAEEGGAEHCQADNRQVGTDYIADWLAAKLAS